MSLISILNSKRSNFAVRRLLEIMELRQLRAFVKIAETCNFSLAAKELYMTQSALSQSLKKLEEELGATLFHRDNHNVGLTEAGDALLPYARRTIEESDNCVYKMHDLMNMKCGTLNIGVTHSFRILTSDTLNVFVKRFPNIKLNIFYKTNDELQSMLLRKEIDVALAFKPEVMDEQIESHNLFEDKLCAVVAKNHVLATKRHITLEEIAEYPLILPAEGTQARSMIDKVLKTHPVDLKPKIVINEITPILMLVSYGEMISILSGISTKTRPDVVAIPVDVTGNTMEGAFHILKNSYFKQSAKEFIKLLCETHLLRLKMNSLFN